MSSLNVVAGDSGNDLATIRLIVDDKEAQVRDVTLQLIEECIKVFEYWKTHGGDQPGTNPHMHAFLRAIQRNRFGDATSRCLVDKVLGYAFSKATKQEVDSRDLARLSSRVAEMKRRSVSLTAITHGLIQNIRGLRFFREVEKIMANRQPQPSCAFCVNSRRDLGQLLIMGLCGHCICRSCFVTKLPDRSVLGECDVDGCNAGAPEHSAVAASDFTLIKPDAGRSFGSKIDAILDLVEDSTRIPERDHIIIFLQFSGIQEALTEALNAKNIPFADTGNRGSCTLEEFKRGGPVRVAILTIDSPDAAGW